MSTRCSTLALVFFFLPLLAWGQSSTDQQPTEASLGHQAGEAHDWVKKDEFRGRRILILDYGPGYSEEIGEVLKELGFEVDVRQYPNVSFPDFKKLSGYDQLWIFSGGAEATDLWPRIDMPQKDVQSIRTFLQDGKGVYVLADNGPYFIDANMIGNMLHGAGFHGDYLGMHLLRLVRNGQSVPDGPEEFSGVIDPRSFTIGVTSQTVTDHELLSGLSVIFEGITICLVRESKKLSVILRTSNNEPLVSVSKNPNELIVYDSAFTRLNFNLHGHTGSTRRWIQNVAGYLMGKKRSDLEVGDPVPPPNNADPSEADAMQTNMQPQAIDDLDSLYKKKGREATLALVEGISVLPDDEKREARNLLVKRLRRMKVGTLSKYLADEDRTELRLAAAKAAGLKNNREMTGPLIGTLSDPSKRVAQAAHESLKKITQQDLGAFPSDSTLKKYSLIKRWKRWWSANGGQ